MARLCSSLLLSLGIASSASAVTMDWTFVGNPGNACDTQTQGCFGSVAYYYSIGTYEVTNAQYAEFLNAKASVSDPLGLYNPSMGDPEPFNWGGITRTGSGPFTYTAIGGREDMPVGLVTFYDALRFANWLHNGQASGDTETGAYTLLGGTETPSNGTTVTRNPGATIFLTSEDEWYKAAYYDPSLSSYFDYPAASNVQTDCATPPGVADNANCSLAVGDLTSQGSYTASASPYGTFDQGGNAHEWNEAIINGSLRGHRGGSLGSGRLLLSASHQGNFGGGTANGDLGFRVAPEPSGGFLLLAGLAGLLGLAGWRRALA